METVTDLKARVDFRSLVASTHIVERSSKILCPFHDEQEASCHIYPNGYKCYGCGAYGDHIDWLERIHNLSSAEAIECLRDYAGLAAFRYTSRAKASRFEPISKIAYRSYLRRLRATRRLPRALEGRGLSLEDALGLGIAAIAEDALFPIVGPTGEILALKRRFYRPRNGQRYVYATAGHGSPAWCSAEVRTTSKVLLIEGELNGMVTSLALQEAGVAVAVMAVAGAQGGIYRDILKDKDVFLYADKDEAGELALSRWHRSARRAGAHKIVTLKPLEHDACEIAAVNGRLLLAAEFIRNMFVTPARRYIVHISERVAA